jgi:hypothetical protein
MWISAWLSSCKRALLSRLRATGGAGRSQSLSSYKSLGPHHCHMQVQSDHYPRRLESTEFPPMRKESIQPAQELPYHLIVASR